MIYLTLPVCFLGTFHTAVTRGFGRACGIEQCTVCKEYFTSCFCLHVKLFSLVFFLVCHGNHHFNTWKFCRSRVVILRLFDNRLALLWYRLLMWRGRKTSSYSCFGYTKVCDNQVNNAEVPASKQSQPVNCCRRVARTVSCDLPGATRCACPDHRIPNHSIRQQS